MEVINDLSLTRSWPFNISENGLHHKSHDVKENICQSVCVESIDPLIPTRLPTGSFSRPSTHVSLAHDVTSHVQYSPSDHERISTGSDISSGHHSTLKLSKNGWILSMAEVLNGQNGCYLSGSYTCSSGTTDDHLLHSSTSAHSICGELLHSKSELDLSPGTSSLAFSDGSPSAEGISSAVGNHPDKLQDDFMFELGLPPDWALDGIELPFAYPPTPHTTTSGNSSGGSTDEKVRPCGWDDLGLANISKEHEVVSRSPFDPAEEVHSLRSAIVWEDQKKFDGLEEIFTPARCFREEGRGLNSVTPWSAGSSHIHLAEVPYSAGPAIENGWQDSVSEKDGSGVRRGAFSLYSSSKRRKYETKVQHGISNESASKFNNQFFEDNVASQTPGPIGVVNNGVQLQQDNIQLQQDNTRELGLNPVLGSSLGGAGRSEVDYSEICLVHLLIAGAEAVAARDMDLASVILVRLKELVSSSGSTMQRVAAYFSDGLQSRIEGNNALDRIGSNKSQSDIIAAFQILHEISPYIKFGHFTANQALLEAVEGEKSVHIVDFEIMEGIQWPPFMQALVSRRAGPPHLRITALCRPHSEHGLAAVQQTGKRLESFAASLNLPFVFNIARVNNEEEFSVSSIKLVKGEALAVNCMLHLPHMPTRTPTSVASFLHRMRKLSPTVLTVVEEELGCSAMAVASYFFEALHHYSAICDSLEACLSNETVARTLVERIFLAPRINSTVMFWSGSSAQTKLGTEFVTYNWCSLVRSVGFKSLPLSFQNLSQARLLLGLYKDGFKLDERSNRLLLGWRSKPLFAASVWN